MAEILTGRKYLLYRLARQQLLNDDMYEAEMSIFLL